MKNRIEAQRPLAWPQQQMEWAGSGTSGIRRCYDPSSVAWTRHGNLLLMRGDGADVLTVSLAPSVVASSFVMVAPHVMVRRRAGIRIVEVRSMQLEIERLAMPRGRRASRPRVSRRPRSPRATTTAGLFLPTGIRARFTATGAAAE